MFKSFKTVVVTLTMLAVGYGAHVVFNRPLPSNDSPLAGTEVWSTPNLTLRDGQTLRPDVRLDQAHAPSGGLSPQIRVPVPAEHSDLPGGPVMTPSSNDGATTNGPLVVSPPTVPATPHTNHGQGFPELLPLTSNAGPPPAPSGLPAQDLAATPAASTGSRPSVADYGRAPSAPNPAAPAPAVQPATGGNSWDANVQNVSAISGDTVVSGAVGVEDPFDAIWNSTQTKLVGRDYAQALFTLSLCYGDPSLTSQQQDRVLPLLDQLAGTVIYSRENHLLQPHTTQPGETLAQIASRYSVPPEFLARVNGLPPNAALPPGQNLKVVQGPFRGQLNLSRRELTLFLNRYYAGRFVVSVGRDAPSQDMVLQVGEKSGPRPYHDPATGQQIPPNDPSNPYGSHWIGLQAPGSAVTNLAIHSAGSQLGASDTRGCFSVSARDAADLIAILSVGSRVSVVR